MERKFEKQSSQVFTMPKEYKNLQRDGSLSPDIEQSETTEDTKPKQHKVARI